MYSTSKTALILHLLPSLPGERFPCRLSLHHLSQPRAHFIIAYYNQSRWKHAILRFSEQYSRIQIKIFFNVHHAKSTLELLTLFMTCLVKYSAFQHYYFIPTVNFLLLRAHFSTKRKRNLMI